MKRQRFSELDGIIDRLHEFFEVWASNGTFPAPNEQTYYLVKLAVHEWVANLVQHANFDERNPEILVDISPNGRRVYCMIEDNSEGFDLDTHLSIRQSLLPALPERGMGLLILKESTEHLSYTHTDNGRHRLEFTVSADQDPCLNIPF